ncbi:hypothetical protein JTB14_031615 [Gonioctena quinquepunctata]|nr:hypothetical protein JTB14_031615 [Gonioctena quinquepunctata]
MKDVSKNYRDDELKEHLSENEISFQRLLRIISKARQQPTLMVRVITNRPESYSDKIAKEIFLYGIMHRCEPSFTAQITVPKIKYCNKCCKNGHTWDECSEKKTICTFCSGEHKSIDCEKPNDPKCSNCEGPHPTFSPKCPDRKRIPETPAETAPINPPKVQPLKNLSFESRMMIEHQDLMFLNLMPNDRELVLKMNEHVIRTLYG